MRDLAVGFTAYVVAILSIGALVVYFLLPVAAGLRAGDTNPVVRIAVAPETRAAPEPAPHPRIEPPPLEPPALAPVEASPVAASPVEAPPETPPASAPKPVVVVDEVVAAETDVALADAAVPEAAPEPDLEWSSATKLGLAIDLIDATRAPVAAPAPDVAMLLQRGDALLATGDVAAARLFYDRAAEHGDPAGAFGVARTYDPVFLAQAGFRTARADRAQAIAWYRRAIAAGGADAAAPLERLLGPTIARDSAVQPKS